MQKSIFFVGILICAGTIAAQENLIQNGTFSDSSGNHWTFDANNTRATGNVEMGRYTITIESGTGKELGPQLQQRNLEMKANEGYILSFKVSASDSSFIRVAVGGDGTAILNDTATAQVKVATVSKTFTIPFFVERATGSGRLAFICNAPATGIRYSVDSVSIVRNPVPVIRVSEPSPESRWISGTERQIEWQNSGNLEKVRIRFSSDKGSTWSDITPVASNQHSFWWKIPVTVSGNECLIIISDTSRTIADTTQPFKIIAAGSFDAKEMVKNGNFLDSTEWRLSVSMPARAKGGLHNDSEYVITIDTAGNQAWQVKLEQSGFKLENGTMYRFSFDAYASHNRGIYANVGADNGNPAWSVYGGDTIPVAITQNKTRYNQTIIMKYPTSANIRIEFNCGNDTGKVFIDNVSLIKLENANVYVFSPSLGAILKSKSRQNIEWHAEAITTIDLDFSSDSCKTWSPIFENIDNLGVVSWTVPDVSSERCFIRIKQAANDSVIGASSQFVINAFGTPVKTGELIVNGSFTNSLKGWNTRFTNAQGQALSADQSFKVTISQSGEDLGNIVLSQGGIPVLKDNVYTLAFDAFANGTRAMGIAVVTENDSSKLLDTILNLPSVEQRTTFKFTAAKDAMVRLEFHLGGSRAGVFIDDVSFYTGILSSIKVSQLVQKNQFGRFNVVSVGSVVKFLHCGANPGSVSVFSLKGVLIYKTAVSDGVAVWNGTTSRGNNAARGAYIAVLTAPSIMQSAGFMLK